MNVGFELCLLHFESLVGGGTTYFCVLKGKKVRN